jgi:hypothetical protein
MVRKAFILFMFVLSLHSLDARAEVDGRQSVKSGGGKKSQQVQKRKKCKKAAALRRIGTSTQYRVIAVNSASYKNGAYGYVSRGSFVTLYIYPKISDETFVASYPWPSQTAGGVQITLHEVSNPKSPACTPRILAHAVSGDQSQVNLYLPNHVGSEPFGGCDDLSWNHWSIKPKAGFGSPFMSFNPTGNYLPGLFTENQGGTGVPAGFHINAKTGEWTRLVNCEKAPAQCPISTGGEMNFIILYVTGGEGLSCISELTCQGSVQRFIIGTVDQTLLYGAYAGYLGQEQINLRLSPATPVGKSTLTVMVSGSPTEQRDLTITLGAPN